MKSSAQKKVATTQRFTEIQDIIDSVVILTGGQACMLIEVKPSNFALLSLEDQQVLLVSYSALLNSLSFPIQIIIINRKIDISFYLSLLENAEASAKNQMLSQRIKVYRDFVSDLITKNTVLDKKFYVAISFSFLEKGAEGVSAYKDKNEFAKNAKNLLLSKANSVTAGLNRLGLSSKIMENKELINLYYEIYNHDSHDAASAMMPYVKNK